MPTYDSNFHMAYEKLAISSAREILTILRELIDPKSIIDIGCGAGLWLSIAREMGINDVLGVDGDYVDRNLLRIPREQFMGYDLNQPLKLDRQFDLVMSLEVAEHLPAAVAETFVTSLTGLGKVVLFSAAVPMQGGNYHVNEQWQDYWAKQFAKKNYVAVDCIRRKVWRNDKVSHTYAQNMILYVERSHLATLPQLQPDAQNTMIEQLAIVHPEFYLDKLQRAKGLTFSRAFKALPGLFAKAVGRRLGMRNG